MAADDSMRSMPVPDPDNYPTVRGLSAGRRVFGRYVLETELGAGGMGVVWRARDEELSDLVALKFLPEVVARDAAAVDELREETRNALRLTHPNIVRIRNFEREGNVAAVSMEFIDGTTLSFVYAEAFNQLYANLALAYRNRRLKVVVFTSPLPGEGKTLSVINFALTLAARGRRILLIDADLRCGLVSAVFGCASRVGFAEASPFGSAW